MVFLIKLSLWTSSLVRLNGSIIFYNNFFNTLFLQELGQKSERISTLEREKASLIRELFQTRTQLGGRKRLDSKPDGQSYMP